MHAPEQMGDLMEKWRDRTAREKAEIITAFLNEFVEHANWEEWSAFVQKHQAELVK